MRRLCFLSVLLAALLAPWLAVAEDLYFDSAGVRIRYTVEGQGTPVVLIHGFGGDLDTAWVKTGIVKSLAGDYRVVALDVRGHGRSGKPRDPSAYGLHMAEDVVRLLDHLKIPKAHVIGYSMGGRLTAALLAHHPDRLLTATLGGAGLTDAKGIEARRAVMNRLADSIERGGGIDPLILSLTPSSATPPTKQQMEEMSRMFLARNEPAAIAAVARGVVDLPAPPARLRGNKVPVLAVVGEADARKIDAERLHRLVPNVKLVVIPGATHFNTVTNPRFLDSIKAFLAGH